MEIFTETGCKDQGFSLSKLQMELEIHGEAMKALACYIKQVSARVIMDMSSVSRNFRFGRRCSPPSVVPIVRVTLSWLLSSFRRLFLPHLSFTAFFIDILQLISSAVVLHSFSSHSFQISLNAVLPLHYLSSFPLFPPLSGHLPIYHLSFFPHDRSISTCQTP